jgi:hypothetical protein
MANRCGVHPLTGKFNTALSLSLVLYFAVHKNAEKGSTGDRDALCIMHHGLEARSVHRRKSTLYDTPCESSCNG